MTGRGVDQILSYPSDPELHEEHVKDAREYLHLAEEKNGAIPKPATFSYVWGDALNLLESYAPDLRIINLETSITKSDDYWKGKQVHYRMNPLNVECLKSAKIGCCTMANNHVLDWGFSGLIETIKTLNKAKINSCGAGKNIQEAETPSFFDIKGKGRVLVFSIGSIDSGIPLSWAAQKDRSGVNLINNFSNQIVNRLKKNIQKTRSKGDIIVVSIHWGGNWGYTISCKQQDFAHRLIDQAGVDIIHGHSSHHVKAIEVYKKRLILYGCGDFLNDYEGIVPFSRSRMPFISILRSSRLGREVLKAPSAVIKHTQPYRSDLSLMYFAKIKAGSGELVSLEMLPMHTKNFKVNNASEADVKWLTRLLVREEKKFARKIEIKKNNVFYLI